MIWKLIKKDTRIGMKPTLALLVAVAFLMTLSIIWREIIYTKMCIKEFGDQETNIPISSSTYRIIEDKKTYISSQISGASGRETLLMCEFVEQICYAVICAILLMKFSKTLILQISEMNITVLSFDHKDIKRSEINLVCIFLSAYIFLYMYFQSPTNGYYEFFERCTMLFAVFFFVLPFAIILVLTFLQNLGMKIIYACYLAYVIKIIPEIFIVGPLNKEKMENLPYSKFPEAIQEVLMKYKLQDHVYIEKNPSSFLNAALVGHGINTRIEIYGDFDKLEDSKIWAVFMHEMGHAFDHSLYRKASIYFCLLLVDFLIVSAARIVTSRKKQLLVI